MIPAAGPAHSSPPGATCSRPRAPRPSRLSALLFADRGYTNTSVRQVAAAAGVSLETIYAIGGKAAVFLRSFELAFNGTTEGASLLDLALWSRCGPPRPWRTWCTA